MNKAKVDAIVNALQSEAWALDMADRLDGIAENIQAAANGPER